MLETQRCLNCGNLIFDELPTPLPYCSFKCAEQIEFLEYLPEPQLEFEFDGFDDTFKGLYR